MLLQHGVLKKDIQIALNIAFESEQFEVARVLWPWCDSDSSSDFELFKRTILQASALTPECGLLLRNLVNTGNTTGVQMLLDTGIEDNDIKYALLDAAAQKNDEMVKILLPRLRVASLKRVLYFAALNGHLTTIETLVRTNVPRNILKAAATENVDIVGILLHRLS